MTIVMKATIDRMPIKQALFICNSVQAQMFYADKNRNEM